MREGKSGVNVPCTLHSLSASFERDLCIKLWTELTGRARECGENLGM